MVSIAWQDQTRAFAKSDSITWTLTTAANYNLITIFNVTARDVFIKLDGFCSLPGQLHHIAIGILARNTYCSYAKQVARI